MTLSLQGFLRANGALGVIGIAAGTALPAGTQMFGGLARSPDGDLYVVFA